jgi:hypothetical protein
VPEIRNGCEVADCRQLEGDMSGTKLNEEKFNIEVRGFLKKVGVTSQREIERAVREALETGKLSGRERLKARMTLEIKEIGVQYQIDGDIAIG